MAGETTALMGVKWDSSPCLVGVTVPLSSEQLFADF